MRILRLNAYFEPEITASTHLMKDLYNGFAENKILTICYTPMPTRGITAEVRKIYKHKKEESLYNGTLLVRRFSMFREGKNVIQRAIRYLICSVIEYIKGVNTHDIDIVCSGSTPPTNGLISALVAKKLTKKYNRKIPFVYDLQDIFPDSMVNADIVKKDSLLWKIGRNMEEYTYNNAEKIIVPSNTMKKNLLNKGVDTKKIHVISNWIDTEKIKPIKRIENKLVEEYNLNPSDFIVVYAGNFGAAQGANVVIKAAKILKKISEIHFVIFGGGAYFEEAKEEIVKNNLTNVTIDHLLPEDRVAEVYSLGDCSIITCKRGTGSASMPSKTWNIMACNTNIIASYDQKSELNDVIESNNAGICVKPEDPECLATAIKKMYLNRIEKNNNSRKYVLQNASKDYCVNQYINLLKTV